MTKGKEYIMQIQELTDYLNSYLDTTLFKDYAPNGLQVSGKETVRKVVLGVSASLSLIDHAAKVGADAVLVHHGWFWKGEAPEVVGMKRRRLAAVLAADINLLAYHLPLDAHPDVGNNAELGRLLGLTLEKRTGFYDLLSIGVPSDGPVPVGDFLDRIEAVLGRRPMTVGQSSGMVRRIGWCSGAAQDNLMLAAAEGCDFYLSGEISERTTYEAEENGILYAAAGHHATERFGIQALGSHLEARFPELEISYFETNNPV